jgi:hypothetical protein
VQLLDGGLVRQLRANPRQRHRKVNRLGHVVVGTKAERVNDVAAIGPRGHHDDGKRARRMLLANAAEDFEAAHPRHFDVEQHEVERGGGDEQQRFGAAGGDGDAVAFHREPSRQGVAVGFVIVDDEERGRCGHFAALCDNSISIFSISR